MAITVEIDFASENPTLGRLQPGSVMIPANRDCQLSLGHGLSSAETAIWTTAQIEIGYGLQCDCACSLT